jgi:hypothetical protein
MHGKGYSVKLVTFEFLMKTYLSQPLLLTSEFQVEIRCERKFDINIVQVINTVITRCVKSNSFPCWSVYQHKIACNRQTLIQMYNCNEID